VTLSGGWARQPSKPWPGLAVALAASIALPLFAPGATPSANAATASKSRVTTLYHKSRSFRVPITIDPEDSNRLKELQLWVSDDSGFTWKASSRTTPDRPVFTFRAKRDAEYWFAVRTIDTKGNIFPGEDEKVEPTMKVLVDTTPPTLVLEPDGRRGSLAAVRWEAVDEHLDLKSLVLEYQVEGGRDWRQVPIRRPARIGSENWDAGTAEPLKVRGSVSDKAGNVTETMITVSEGTPANPGFASGAKESAEFSSPPVSQISSRPPFGTGQDAVRPPGSATPAPNQADPFPFPPADQSRTPAPAPSPVPLTNGRDLFAGSEPAAAAPATPAQSGDTGGQTLLVPSPRFPLQYAVDDSGPNGPAVVELWVTSDGGRNWIRRGEDPDRVSPFQVDLAGEGTFGLRLVARAASGLGDQPPAPGDAPHLWVEVDSTPPTVQLFPPVVGAGAHLGKVAIAWHATDLHLAPSPVMISWRPDQPGARWQPITPDPIENTGKFIWNVPPSVPPRFHIRVDAVDTMGNRGFADTPEASPVVLDRTRPRGRIIGLDPSARTGLGPAARPMR
jgi:hypothetical protein